MAENVIAQAAVKLTADSSQLGAGITSALAKLHGPLGQVAKAGESSASGIGGAFSKAGGMVAAGMAAAGVAAVAFAIKSADTFKNVGGEVLKLQRYTGGSVESMSKLRFAAQQSGIDTDKLALSLGKMSKAVAAGSPEFDKLGVATADAHGKTLPLDTILLNVADKFQKMPNGVDKTAAAIKLFGKAGADLLPMLNKGKDGLQALESQAQKYGLVLTSQNIKAVKEATAAHREQAAAMQGLQVQIGANVLPALTKLTKAFTEGLISVMPTVTGIMNATVIPAFSAFAAVVSGASHFVEGHAGLVKGLAVVVGAFLVPALGLWLAEQAALVGSGFLMFLSNTAGAAMQVAAKMGLMGMSAVAAGAALAGLGVLFAVAIANEHAAADAATKATKAIVDAAPADAVVNLTKRQAELTKEIHNTTGPTRVLGGLLGGLEKYSGDNRIKAYARERAELKSTNEALAAMAKSHTDVATNASKAGDAIDESLTKMGATMESLGGATHLTKDRIEELAASMKINLEKATDTQIAQMTDQAGRLSITAEHTLKLKDANEILSDWTQDATKKTAAFKSALDALIGTETSAESTTIAWRQTLDDTVAALKGLKYSSDLTTQAGRDYQSQILKSVDATTKMIDEDQKRLGQGPELQALEAQHVADLKATWKAAGLTAAQIQALLVQYNLTPAALSTIVTLDTTSAEAKLRALNVALDALAAKGGMSSANAVEHAAAISAPGGGKRAGGGPVMAGVPYLIGEQGPEIMTFKGDGNIQPNSALAGTGRGHVTYINLGGIHVGTLLGDKTKLFAEIRTFLDTYNERN